MKALAATLCAWALSGCASIMGGIPAQDRTAVLKGAAEHIDKCDRHYWGSGGIGAGAGFDINCKPPALTPEQISAMIAIAVKQAVDKALASDE